MPAITRAMREISGNEATKQQNGHGTSKIHLEGATTMPSYNFLLSSKPESISAYPQTTSDKIVAPGTTSRGDDWFSTIFSFSTSTPAIILNELYTSYIAIDRAISLAATAGTQHPWSRNNTQKYLGIVSHFASNESPELWQTGIAVLTQQYLDGTMTSDTFKNSLESIMTAAERLEEVQAMVEQSLEIELKKSGIPVTVPESFWDFLDVRARALEIASMRLEKRLDESSGQ